MGEFDEFITGNTELTVGGKELLLSVAIEDKRVLKACIGNGKELTEAKLKIMDDAFIHILQKSYPGEKPKAMEGFYNRFDMEFMQEFMIKFGWAKRETFEEKKVQNPN